MSCWFDLPVLEGLDSPSGFLTHSHSTELAAQVSKVYQGRLTTSHDSFTRELRAPFTEEPSKGEH